MAKYTIVIGDDWSGLYVDGTLVIQGHELREYEVLVAAQTFGAVTEVEQVEANLGWLEDRGDLPSDLIDVVTV